MHAYLSPLLALMLLGQAVLGLCWRPFDCAECQAKVGVRVKDCCCDTRESGSEDREPPSCPVHREKDCAGVCTYLPPQKVLADGMEFDVALDVLVASLSLPGLTTTDEPLLASEFETAVKPPIRLHLLNQNLRI